MTEENIPVQGNTIEAEEINEQKNEILSVVNEEIRRVIAECSTVQGNIRTQIIRAINLL